MSAWQVALKAQRYVGFAKGLKIARAAKRKRLPYPLAFALVEQESGFRHIFGHDTTFLAGQPVTHDRYQRLIAHIRAGGTSNGVGYTQITYPGYLLEHPGLWRKGKNLRFGFGLVKGFIDRYGKQKGLAIYNGGPSNPQYDYADSVLRREARWRQRLS